MHCALYQAPRMFSVSSSLRFCKAWIVQDDRSSGACFVYVVASRNLVPLTTFEMLRCACQLVVYRCCETSVGQTVKQEILGCLTFENETDMLSRSVGKTTNLRRVTSQKNEDLRTPRRKPEMSQLLTFFTLLFSIEFLFVVLTIVLRCLCSCLLC